MPVDKVAVSNLEVTGVIMVILTKNLELAVENGRAAQEVLVEEEAEPVELDLMRGETRLEDSDLDREDRSVNLLTTI